jgi:predicted acetyltransferase
MNLEIIRATAGDRDLLHNLWQFYLYDFTEFTGDDVPASGRWDMDWIDDALRGGDVHEAFIARVDGRLAGVALVEHRDDAQSRAESDLLEFFVLRKYRRSGIGTRFACAMFDSHTGRWELRVIAENTPAQAFWTKTIDAYTGGAFEKRDREDRAGIVFYFDSPRSSS